MIVGRERCIFYTPAQDVAGIVRYMTHANRRDFLDGHWTMVAQEKTFGLSRLLLSRQKDNSKLLKKLRLDVLALERRAGGKEVAEQKAQLFRDRIEGRLRPNDQDDLLVRTGDQGAPCTQAAHATVVSLRLECRKQP
jgi:hypothetical protein